MVTGSSPVQPKKINIYNIQINDDYTAMRIALSQAKKSIFFSSPNPRVGCIIVKNKKIIGLGYTKFIKKDHAEIQAIKNVYKSKKSLIDSIIYITLEPCDNKSLTLPCFNKIIKEKFNKIVFSIHDPNNKKINKFSIKIKIKIICGLLKREAYELNIGFFKRIIKNLPWIRSKIASSLDKKLSLNTKESKWISNNLSRIDNQYWRSRSCAILTGINTFDKDNPKFNIRYNYINNIKQPCYLTLNNKKINISKNLKILILEKKNNILNIIKKLSKLNFNEIQIESGSILNTFLLSKKLIDEIILYISSKFIGNGYNLFNLPYIENMSNKFKFKFFNFKKIGENLRIILRKKY